MHTTTLHSLPQGHLSLRSGALFTLHYYLKEVNHVNRCTPKGKNSRADTGDLR